jgi:hypothetical protein
MAKVPIIILMILVTSSASAGTVSLRYILMGILSGKELRDLT